MVGRRYGFDSRVGCRVGFAIKVDCRVGFNAKVRCRFGPDWRLGIGSGTGSGAGFVQPRAQDGAIVSLLARLQPAHFSVFVFRQGVFIV